MKKAIGIIILGLLFVNPAYSKVGKGDLQMSPEVLKHFIKYLRNEYAKTFVVSSDGKFATYTICGDISCSGSSIFKQCKKESGSKCYIFSQRKKQKKIIRWNKVDYIFPSEYWSYNVMVKSKHLKGSNRGIKKEISDNDIIDILNKFGFISGNLALQQTETETTTSTTLTKKKVEQPKSVKGDLQGFLKAIAKGKESGFTLDFDSTAKEYGYSSFAAVVEDYKKQYGVKNLTVDEAKEYLFGVDRSIEIVESQENLDKLHSLIVNRKNFKRKTGYYKKKLDGKNKALAVYFNYEKEMAKITKDPNLKKISPFEWGWGWGTTDSTRDYYALDFCNKNSKELKLTGGECIIVDTNEKNALKPRIKLAKKQDEIDKKKLAEEKRKLEKEKKKSEEEKKRLAENKKNKEDTISASSGTGFFITGSGHIVSNNHVIDSCSTVKVHYQGDIRAVKVLAVDRSNDLALMKMDSNPDDFFYISNEDATLMEDIYVAGYPFGKVVSGSVKITKGVVSSLSGLGDNYSNLQIDAALQPGNSGGPIINQNGEVIGVAVSKLDYKKVMEAFGTIPEGTNFGIKSSTLLQFVKSNNVSPASKSVKNITKKAISDKIVKATVYLDCWMTASKIEEMETQKAFFPGLKKGFDFPCYNECKERNDETYCRQQCSLQ